MNQRLLFLIQVIPINHHQVSVNYFCYHHWTIIKINQVIDEPEIIQCLIYSSSLHSIPPVTCHGATSMGKIPRTIIHPTPPHPTPPPTPPCRGAWYNVIICSGTQQRDQHSMNDNTPLPPPHPALSRSMIQRDHLQQSNTRCAVIGEPGSPRVYIYIYLCVCQNIQNLAANHP